jgi:hypothetical protein
LTQLYWCNVRTLVCVQTSRSPWWWQYKVPKCVLGKYFNKEISDKLVLVHLLVWVDQLNGTLNIVGKGPVPFPEHSTKPIDITCLRAYRISFSKARISRYLSCHTSLRLLPVVMPHWGRYLLCRTSLKPLPAVSYLSQTFYLLVHTSLSRYLLCHTSLSRYLLCYTSLKPLPVASCLPEAVTCCVIPHSRHYSSPSHHGCSVLLGG